MAAGARERLIGYPTALMKPFLLLLRVIRFFARSLWRGGLFPLIPGRIYDHGKPVGRLSDGTEIAGKTLAVALLGALEAARLLRRPVRGWLGPMLIFGALWSFLGYTGRLYGVLAEILTQTGFYMLAAVGAVYMLLLPIGIYRVRKYEGLRKTFFRKLDS